MGVAQRFVRLLVIVVLGGSILGVCLVALGPGVGKIAASAKYTGTVAPDLRPLEGPTTLYDADGNVMDRLGDLDRTQVDLSEVPKSLVDAVVATEDHTFFTNPGVDVRSSIRAFLSNVDSGGIGQGGSTITQQLIKNRYFTNPKRDLDRKVREAILAARLTGEWSKRRILQEYLNTVYFGANAYGVQAAAQRIIGVPLPQLDLGDAALLAGLIKDPVNFDPFAHPDAALRRRAVVLRAMEKQKKINAAELAFANAKPLPTRVDCNVAPDDPKCLLLQPHSLYAVEVKNRLLELKELGPNEKAAEKRVFAGGLRVYTAYQPELQAKAQAAVDSTVGRFAPTFQAAMAVMDPRTGAVPAIVSGTGRDYRGLNLATMGPVVPNSGRFVGSTFKPITLATAFEDNKYSPKDTVAGGAPCYIKYAEGTPGQPGYLPWWDVATDGLKGHKFLNASGEGGGTADLFSQTKNSVNCAFLRLMTSVGPPKVRDMAYRLGMTRPIGPYVSMGIGDTAHSPVEMATVYSSFANDGIKHDPVFITRIEDSDGRVIYRAPGGKRVLTPQVARTVTDVLSHVTEGTAPNAKLADRPLAGKTGTRDNSEDAWFAGYTPQLVAVVWMGDPASSQHAMTSVGGVRVFGGTYPAIMWQKFMTSALAGQSVIQFTPPDEGQWPDPSRVNPDGGRDERPRFSEFSTTTSSTLPTDSTTSSTEPTTTSSSPPDTTTSSAPPP
jgi:membrane peptidoglycan carboxypeptidase